MLHLLPEQQKKKVLVEYQKRLGITVCLFVIGISIVAMIFLLPSYIAARNRYVKIETKKLTVENRLAQISSRDSGNIVKEVSDRIAALAPFGATTEASTVFDRFLLLLTPGIQLNHMGYLANPDKTTSLVVDGTASSRDALLAFSNSINSSGQFGGARVPLSSLRSDRNIGFKFELTVNIAPANAQ